MAPPHLRHVDPPQVGKLLSACLHEGCRGASLNRTTNGRKLIDVLVPEHLFPSWSDVDRAHAVEQLLVRACEAWGEPRGVAAAYVLGLNVGWFGRTLTDRREKAGEFVGKSGEGFRRKHEREVLHDVAFEAIRLAADLPFAESMQLRLLTG